MLKSRALPDDFDTTQVLRTPFDGKTSDTPVASPLESGPPAGPCLVANRRFQMLLTDGLQRMNEDDYVISPLSSTSTTGNGFPATADRHLDSYPPPGPGVGRGPPAAPIPELQRNTRGPFPFPRSSSFSESSFNTGLHFPGRFSRPGEPLNHPSMPYGRRPLEFGMNRPANGMIVGYDHHRPLEGSVSPTGPPEHSVPYHVDSHSTSPNSLGLITVPYLSLCYLELFLPWNRTDKTLIRPASTQLSAAADDARAQGIWRDGNELANAAPGTTRAFPPLNPRLGLL